MRWFAVCLLLVGNALAQNAPQTPLPKFKATEVEISPYRNSPFANGGVLHGDRYLWHQATLVDLIADAYSVDFDLVQGGPAWLERNRFEVTGLADPKTSKADLKLMLQSLLADRFGVVVHTGEKEMPAYVLTVPGKDGKTKMTESEAGGNTGCDPVGQPTPELPLDLKCHNFTMDVLATSLHQFAGGYLDKVVVNKTGLKGEYDFELKWHARQIYDKLGAAGGGISIFDAVSNIGLNLALETASQQVLLVDKASNKPTPNAPDVAKLLPPAPPAVFEVATIKPSAPDEKQFARISGNTVNVTGLPLSFLISFAWDLNNNSKEQVVNAPKWYNDDKFDINAKVASEAVGQPGINSPPIDIEDLKAMLRQLITERFQMKVHREDRPMDAYTLYAAMPKMKTADPTERTKYINGPAPGGKDPRKTQPILNKLVTCQNMTMAEFADEMQHFAGGYVYGPVLDKTGLGDARFDFTLSYSSADRTSGLPAPKADGTALEASDPNGAVTLYDAVVKQLGLKLVKEKRPMPTLVFDSIQEKPTEN